MKMKNKKLWLTLINNINPLSFLFSSDLIHLFIHSLIRSFVLLLTLSSNLISNHDNSIIFTLNFYDNLYFLL